jgi:hypothetical protein
LRLHPSKRAGKSSKLLINLSTASTEKPIKRSGKDINQTIGKRIKASKATGQQSINNIHQLTNNIRAFIFASNKFYLLEPFPFFNLQKSGISK